MPIPTLSCSPRKMTSSWLPSVESIQQLLNEISSSDDNHYSWENHRRFSGYAKRLQHVMNQLLRLVSPDTLPASVQTSVKGIAGDLTRAAEILAVYANKGKIYVLINCEALCAGLHECTLAIGGWLALLHSAIQDIPDLNKKIADLSTDMKQAQFRVRPCPLSKINSAQFEIFSLQKLISFHFNISCFSSDIEH